MFLLIYLFSWVIFFELARVFFLISTAQYAKDVATSLKFQSLWYGLKMDLSIAAYITLLVCLFVIAAVYIPFFRKRIVYFTYTGIILFLLLFITIADAESYKAWGTRLDYTPIRFLSSPKEAMASIGHLPVIWIIIGLLLIYLLLFWFFRKAISGSIIHLSNNNYKAVQLLLVLAFTIALIIPIRGGLQLTPINQSHVFFSNNQYANNAAVNGTWNFMQSLTKAKYLSKNIYQYMDQAEADSIVNSLFEANGNVESIIKDRPAVKPNVIVILWESFTEKVVNISSGGKRVIKYFPELMKEGIYFSNCYSSGDRTDKGISAVLSSYPALPKESIINYSKKTSKLPGLGNIFLKQGYHTSFYYGGESEFMNIKSYISAQQFQQLITKEDFASTDMNSKWGAHDEVVMKRLLGELSKIKEPYFATWLTLSSHEPFETPVPKVFKGNDKETKFLNSLNYTDSVIYTFINELKKLPSWQNTIVIISADHGHYLPITGKRADDYRIPVLWLGGALKRQNFVVEKVVNQLDMAGSLIQQLHLDSNRFIFSKDVFDSTSKHWAFFTYNDGIGFVTDTSRLLFDNAGKRTVFEEGKTNAEHEKTAKALMQKIYSDFLNR